MKFSKYQGAGNDFIIIDDRNGIAKNLDSTSIAQWCDRHFGIGADGLMLLREHQTYDFEMVYFNSDGQPSTMCGNGGRCLTSFAHRLGLVDKEAHFLAVDGPHKAKIHSAELISLEMIDVLNIEEIPDGLLIDTGSPHVIKRVEELSALDVVKEGRAIRNADPFKEEGVNVNFIELQEGRLHIRTYERGVEDETLACGTGVTAAAIAACHWGLLNAPVHLIALGGKLEVTFDVTPEGYQHVWKTGPVEHVFDGEWKA